MNQGPMTKKQFAEGPEDDICNINNTSKIPQNSKSSQLSTDHSEMNLQELVTSLKEKISLYESEIQSLIDEKLRMQIEINNLQLINCKSKDLTEGKKKAQNDLKSGTLIELNKQFANESSGLKRELNILNQSIAKQKELIKNPKLMTSLREGPCPNCETKNEELSKLNSEKATICSAIQDLKHQLEEMKKSQAEKKNKKKHHDKTNKSESLPNIEQYFILNNKFQLVDSDRNLWHMKKCQKFKRFKEEKKNEFTHPEDILKAFVEIYETKSEDEEEDKKSENPKEGEKKESLNDNSANEQKVSGDNQNAHPKSGENDESLELSEG